MSSKSRTGDSELLEVDLAEVVLADILFDLLVRDIQEAPFQG